MKIIKIKIKIKQSRHLVKDRVHNIGLSKGGLGNGRGKPLGTCYTLPLTNLVGKGRGNCVGYQGYQGFITPEG
jgi:hypothetical protein